MAKPVKVIGVLVVVLVGAAVVFEATKEKDLSPARQAAASGEPPADAEFLDPEITSIMVLRSGTGAARGNAPAPESPAIGRWIPDPGWSGVVSEVTPESGGRYAVRMEIFSSTVPGGSYWIVAVTHADTSLTKNDEVSFTGKVSLIERSPVTQFSPVPTYRIVIEPAKVWKR